MIWLLAAWLMLAPPRYTLPPFKPAPTKESGRLQVGQHRALPAAALKKGKWQSAANGQRLWGLELEAPGATGLRLHFVKFAAGEGEVRLYAGGGKQVAGPYSRTGIDASGDFWSEAIEGGLVVVEFAAPPGYKAKLPPFEIPEISHLYR